MIEQLLALDRAARDLGVGGTIHVALEVPAWLAFKESVRVMIEIGTKVAVIDQTNQPIPYAPITLWAPGGRIIVSPSSVFGR